MYRAFKRPDLDIVLLLDDGRFLTKVWARRDAGNSVADVYKYKMGRREVCVVLPLDAPKRWISVPLEPFIGLGAKDFRMYGATEGKLQGWGWTGAGTTLSVDQFSALQLDGAAVKLSKALTGGGFDWKLVLVGVAIVAAVFLGYTYLSKDSGASPVPTDNHSQVLPSDPDYLPYRDGTP